MVLTAIFSSVAFIFKWKTGFIKPVVEEKEEEKEEVNERRKRPLLRHHPVFMEIAELESYFATRYRHGDLGRQLLASEMMIHKIRIWRPLLEKFAEKIDECCADCNLAKPECNKVLNLAMELLIDGMEEYVGWHNKDVVLSADGSKVYSKVDKETMGIYIEKFQCWHESREELVRMITHDVGSHPALYDNCHQQAYLILQGYHLAFSLCRVDSDKTLRSLNGSLTNKKFLGTTVGNVE